MATERDPVCGMDVDPATAIEAAHDGQTYHFCSTACRDRFNADPAAYSAAGHVEMEKHDPPRTTTGWFTAPRFGSAGSGGAELEPLPERHDHE